MFLKISVFIKSERGAVTVDWVVLTAAIVSLAAVIIIAINGPTGNVGEGIGSFMTDFSVGG